MSYLQSVRTSEGDHPLTNDPCTLPSDTISVTIAIRLLCYEYWLFASLALVCHCHANWNEIICVLVCVILFNCGPVCVSWQNAFTNSTFNICSPIPPRSTHKLSAITAERNRNTSVHCRFGCCRCCHRWWLSIWQSNQLTICPFSTGARKSHSICRDYIDFISFVTGR